VSLALSLCQYVLRPRRGLGQASLSLEVTRRASIAGFRKLAFNTWDIFHQHHNSKGKIVMASAHGIGIFFGDGCRASLVWALHGKRKSYLAILLRIICSPQVFDKATISYVASSKKMMLAANSANHGDNKVAGSGAGAIFDQNEVPKPGPQNRQFCGNPWGVPPQCIYIYSQHKSDKSDPHPRCGHPRCGQRHDERHAASLVCCSAVRPLENLNSAAASVGFHLARFETTTTNVSQIEFKAFTFDSGRENESGRQNELL